MAASALSALLFLSCVVLIHTHPRPAFLISSPGVSSHQDHHGQVAYKTNLGNGGYEHAESRIVIKRDGTQGVARSGVFSSPTKDGLFEPINYIADEDGAKFYGNPLPRV